MLSDLNTLIEKSGVLMTWFLLFTLFLIFLIRFLYKNFKFYEEILKSIKSQNVYLNTDLSIDLYRKFAEIHTYRKVEFLLNILENNDLEKRKEEIKSNIKNEFIRITNEEAEDMSRFKSVVGDMGHVVLTNIDWEEYFDDTFRIIFNKKSTAKQKIFDFKKVMAKYIIKIEKIIRQLGEKNE